MACEGRPRFFVPYGVGPVVRMQEQYILVWSGFEAWTVIGVAFPG